jgi:chromosome segregation ATPase
LQTLVDVLQAQLAKAETEAAHARQQLEAERSRSNRAEQRADALRGQLDQANPAEEDVRAAIAELTRIRRE